MAEPSAHNRRVGGSSPSLGTISLVAYKNDQLRKRVARALLEYEALASWRTRLALWLIPGVIGGIFLQAYSDKMAEVEAYITGNRERALKEYHEKCLAALEEGKPLPSKLAIVRRITVESERASANSCNGRRGPLPHTGGDGEADSSASAYRGPTG